jgi:hypothetical protein
VHGLKPKMLAAAAAAALLCMPVTPAAAAGPLLLLPALGHAVAAMARLATLPLIAASSPPPARYPLPPVYNAAGRGYYAPGYPAAPRVSYAPPVAYYAPPQSYYRPAQVYSWPRRDYAPTARYSGWNGAHASYRSSGFGYRRR